LLEDLQKLKPTKGFCILIDMVGSVALKDRGLYEWCAAICNVISKSRTWLSGVGGGEEAEETDGRLLQQWGLLPLKIVGDCIMFYIPEATMPEDVSVLTIFSSLRSIVLDPVYPGTEVRVAAAFCEDSYEISFVKGTNDVYGKDIDLTARLLEKAQPQEILMNYGFYQQGWARQNECWPEFGEVHSVGSQQLKGFKEPVNIFRWCGPLVRSRTTRTAQPLTST